MQHHNDVVAEFSRRLLKEFEKYKFTEAEQLEKAELAIKLTSKGFKGNKATKSKAAGGAPPLVSIASSTIFDFACSGAGIIDCSEHDSNYRCQAYLYTYIVYT